MKGWRHDDGHDAAHTRDANERAPGKQPATAQHYQPVQAKGGAPDANTVKDAAAAGISGSGGPLPHLDTIQTSFGRHDVSHVVAHTDSNAAQSCDSMGGALGYTSGDHVALKDTGLHTSAHEAAHAVQQQSGEVRLSDGVGQTGDAYEQHADAVADAVVAGQSAEPLLDGFVGTGASGAGHAVQRQDPPDAPDNDLPADIASWTIEQCVEVTEAMYVGGNTSIDGQNWTNRGILDHKIDMVHLTVQDLFRSDPTPISQTILKSVLVVGVAAGAAALAAPVSGALALALIAGGGAVVTEIPNYFQDGGPAVDPTEFGRKYLGALRTGWPASVGALTGQMATEGVARRVCASTRALANNSNLIQQHQRNELLDEWLNAVNAKTNGTSRGGMGSEDYDDPSTGRFHLGGAYLSEDLDLRDPRFAFTEGIRLKKLRDTYLDRKIGDMKCARTMALMTHWGATSLALEPSGDWRLEYSGMSVTRARGALASYHVGRVLDTDNMGWFEGDHDQDEVDANWRAGVQDVWDAITDKTPREMGITSIKD